jgi:hypothetical protein
MRIKIIRKTLGLGILSLALHGFVWQGQAQQTLDITLSINGNMAGAWAPLLVPTGNGYIVNNVGYTNLSAGYALYFHDMSLELDPSISASVDVVNTTTSLQNYTLTFMLPVSAIPGSTRMAGSTQGGVTDTGGDGATLSTVGAGSALYFGQIDGVNVPASALFPNLTSITAGSFLSTSQSANFGLPGVTTPGPAVGSSIGIEHQFSLTPGDRATFTSVFVVNPVPEPGSLSLLALGGLALFYRHRRR